MPNLERLLYGLPPPSSTRPADKPLKLLCLGYSHSSTNSLHAALTTLGLATYHSHNIPLPASFAAEALAYLGRRKFGSLGGVADLTDALFPGARSRQPTGDCRISAREFDLVLAHYQAVTDGPLACFAPELMAAYPDAKVVLNTRDVDEWYESYGATFAAWDGGVEGWKCWLRSWVVAELYWLELCKTLTQRKYFYGDFARTGKWVYRQHCDGIRGALRGQPGRLQEWRVEDGWGPLCKFLDVEVPGREGGEGERAFPKGNESAEVAARVRECLQGWNEKADQRLAMVAAFGSLAVGVAVAVVLYQYLEAGM